MSDWRTVFHLERRREHHAWMDRGYSGEGRLVVEDVDLSDAQLRAALLVGARFVRCKFDRAVTAWVNFERAELVECSARDAVFQHISVRDAVIETCAFESVDFRRGGFSGARIVSSSMIECVFVESWFVASDVRQVQFSGSSFLDAQLDRSTFEGCSFRGVDLSEGQAEGARFIDCDFRGASFEKRVLRDTAFTRCKFHGVTGLPNVLGPVHIEAPDFSEAGDCSDIRSADTLIALWSSSPP